VNILTAPYQEHEEEVDIDLEGKSKTAPKGIAYSGPRSNFSRISSLNLHERPLSLHSSGLIEYYLQVKF
jgi:hypothetical protein